MGYIVDTSTNTVYSNGVLLQQSGATGPIGPTGPTSTVAGPTGATGPGLVTVIASGSFSGTSLTLSSIPQTYSALKLVMDITSATGLLSPNISLSGQSSNEYTGLAFTTNYTDAGTVNAIVSSRGFGGYTLKLGSNIAGESTACIVDFPNYTSTTTRKTIKSTWTTSSGVYSRFGSGQSTTQTAAITTMLIEATYDLSGTYTLYGVK
jgi:hypothetical protein